MSKASDGMIGGRGNGHEPNCRSDDGVSIASYIRRLALTGIVKTRRPVYMNHGTVVHDFTGVVVKGFLRHYRMTYSFGSGAYRVENVRAHSESSMGTIDASVGVALLLCDARNFAVKPLEEWRYDPPGFGGIAELIHRLALKLENSMKGGVWVTWKV